MNRISLHMKFAMEVRTVPLSDTWVCICITFRWSLRSLWWSETRVCIWLIWHSSQKFHSQRTDICVLQVEHITVQKLGYARYGVDITLHEPYITLFNSGLGVGEQQSSLPPQYPHLLFYKCIFQVSPFTSVGETQQPPKPGVPLFTGILTGHLQPK